MKGDTISRSALLNEFDPDEFPSSIRVRSRILQAPAVDAAPEWISVKDRLPEKGSEEWYNIVLTNQRCMTKRVVRVGYWDGYHKRFWGFEAPSDYNVTHWMPLPEPPKEARENDG